MGQCEFVKDTKYGTIIIGDETKSYEQAKMFCEENSAILMPLNTKDKINEVSKVLSNCKNGSSKVQRYSNYWRIGLLLNQHVWSDGELFDINKQQKLFSSYGQDYFKENCLSAALHPENTHLSIISCTSRYRFLCSKTSNQSINNEQDDKMTEVDNVSIGNSTLTYLSHLLVGMYVSFFLISLVILCLLAFSLKKKESRTPASDESKIGENRSATKKSEAADENNQAENENDETFVDTPKKSGQFVNEGFVKEIKERVTLQTEAESEGCATYAKVTN